MIRIFLLLFLLFASLPAQAQLPGAPLHVDANIEAETSSPAPGDTVTIAFAMDPKAGWHDYWINPGDAGTPLEITWGLPAGVTAGAVRAPVPETLVTTGFMNHIYKKEHVFLVDLKIAADISPGTLLPVTAKADWSACTDRICVPQRKEFSINLAVGDGKITATQRQKFDDYRAMIPAPLDRAGIFSVDGQTVRYAIPYPASASIQSAFLFLKTPNFGFYTAPQSVERQGDWLFITSQTKPPEQILEGDKRPSEFEEIEALLAIDKSDGLLVSLKRGDMPQAAGAARAIATRGGSDAIGAAPGATQPAGFLAILGLSILGGLLLNLMPCVFPILGLKALSLAKMGGDETAARRDALAYSAGVILSVLALGAAMLALRAAGEQVGWAFQLQEPRIVLALLLLVAAITANLAGFFEINVAVNVSSTSSRFGSFGTGVLAAVVATPCTGPFMAAALGAALLLPTGQALLLFAGLGFGLALPYLAIAYIPALRNHLPKPGPWLGTFRKIMAIPMALTALALLWLLWRLSGETGLMIGIGALFLLSAALFFAGKFQANGKSAKLAVFAAIAVATVAAFILPRDPVAPQETSDDILHAETYSDEKLAEYRNSGRRVFVYFTADWCVTCKINEAAAIEREETAAAFKDKNIAVLVGDWTRRDPELARILARYERSGVPLYLYFGADGKPVILPQILTPSMLTSLE